MEDIVIWVVEWVKSMGYLGIFIMTMIESTFIPIPAEITMIPAGYLVQQGEMNGFLVMICATSGTVTGALINYAIAYHSGRRLIIRYGHYFLMPHYKLQKMEEYFEKYGAVSTFVGRLLPGVRHYISFPAGLARMKLSVFMFYTALGGALWLFVLFALGYYIGENEALIKRYILYFKLLLFFCLLVAGVWYFRRYRKNRALSKLVFSSPPPLPLADGQPPHESKEPENPQDKG